MTTHGKTRQTAPLSNGGIASFAKAGSYPVTGGSDFHRPGPNSLPGIPCTCVYAMSRCPEDILFALRSGHGYVKMAPEMPDVEVHAGRGILGDTLPNDTEVEAKFTGLRRWAIKSARLRIGRRRKRPFRKWQGNTPAFPR